MRRFTSPYLSDLKAPTVTIVCPKCGRRGRLNVARAIARWGDTCLPDFLRVVAADCPRLGKMHDPCGARYEKPLGKPGSYQR